MMLELDETYSEHHNCHTFNHIILMIFTVKGPKKHKKPFPLLKVQI